MNLQWRDAEKYQRKQVGRDSPFPLYKEPAFTAQYLQLKNELELRGQHLFIQTN